MNLEEKIKKILSDKKLSQEKLANKIGMSKANLYNCFKRNSIETKNLEKIAEVLEVPVSYFFDENDKAGDINIKYAKTKGSGNIVNIADSSVKNDKTTEDIKAIKLEMEVKSLKQQLKDKEEIIDNLKQMIDVLKDKR